MLRKLIGQFREFGPAVGLLYAIDRVLSMLSPELHLYVYEFTIQPIVDKPLLSRGSKKPLEIREIKAGDPELALMPVRPEAMRVRLAQHATCLGAFRNGTFIGYMWFCNPAYDEDEVRCTYVLGSAHDSVFDFDFHIFNEHRMGLAFAGLWNGANEFLRRRNVRYTFSRLTRFNVASRRAHRHLGLKVVGRAIFLKAWHFQVMLATLFPFVHISITKSGRVHLTLKPDALKV
jgi:hypothetical protein